MKDITSNIVNPEINSVEDSRLQGVLSNLFSQHTDFKKFQKAVSSYIAEANRYSSPQLEAPKDLEQLFAYSRQEHSIVDIASQMVRTPRSVNGKKQSEHPNWEVNDIGRNVAEGPGLTILDGGPGAGKSFSLQKAADVMQVPVICLGATESAAAGLYKDMSEDQDKKAKSHEKGKKTAPKIDILGGLTVDQLLQKKPLKDKGLEKRKQEILNTIKGSNPKPCIMVDEAGLLDHDQMGKLMSFMQNNGCKLILAGDSQQIPPGKGQPFKMLAESLKDTPAYVNAPYVFRQKDFMEKAITSGIYHGNNSKGSSIPEDQDSQKTAIEFMTAAYDLGEPKIGLGYTQWNEKKGEYKEVEFGLKQRLKEKYPEVYKDDKLTDEEKKKQAVKLYVAEMTEKSKHLSPKEKEKMDEFVKNGFSLPEGQKGEIDKDQYDLYVCTALVAQARGVRSYEDRGKTITGEKTPYDTVAENFASGYAAGLKKAGKDAKFSDGMLAITATPEEAQELNKVIRERLEKSGTLPEKEPVIIDGERKLLSQDEIKQEKKSGKTVDYAYALDVKTTQGMSQDGPVTLVVTKDSMEKGEWRGGEVLVGATRHKKELQIMMQDGINPEKFFEASTHQFASARVVNEAFQPALFTAAKEFEKTSGKNKGKTETLSLQEQIAQKSEKASGERMTVMAQISQFSKPQGIDPAVTRKLGETKTH